MGGERWLNPRPDALPPGYGVSPPSPGRGGVRPLLGVSKRSVVELRGKDQQIALAEYSRLVVLFLVICQYLTKFWQVKAQIFGNSMIFQLHESMSAKLATPTFFFLLQKLSLLERRVYDVITAYRLPDSAAEPALPPGPDNKVRLMVNLTAEAKCMPIICIFNYRQIYICLSGAI